MNRIAYLTKLQHEKPHIHAYDTETLAHGSDVLVEATLTAPGLEAYCDILMPVQTGSSRGKSLYVPTLLAGTHTITGEQKIAVGFAGYVLGQLH